MQEAFDKSAREKIIRAAVELAEADGGAEFTVREIAGRAGVNIGAINYYFGSKDELMRTVARELMRQFVDGLSILDDKSLPPFERLEKSLVHISEMVVARHRFFRQEVFRKERRFRDKHEMAGYFKGIGLEKIRAAVLELDGTLDDTHSFVLALQIFTASVMPNVFFLHRDEHMPDADRHDGGRPDDVRMPSVREQIHGLLARIFPNQD